MSILDRFRSGLGVQRPVSSDNQVSADEQAIARYRYLLRTAPPEAIEQAHAEAFAQLTPDQRRHVLRELSAELPEAERNAALRGGDSPESLARVATRAELREPGTMERAFGGLSGTGVGGAGFGSLLAGSFLSSMAGSVLGTMIAQHFFNSHPEASHLFGGDAHAAGDVNAPDASTAGLIPDPFERLSDGDLANLDGALDGGGFDGGGSWDV